MPPPTMQYVLQNVCIEVDQPQDFGLHRRSNICRDESSSSCSDNDYVLVKNFRTRPFRKYTPHFNEVDEFSITFRRSLNLASITPCNRNLATRNANIAPTVEAKETVTMPILKPNSAPLPGSSQPRQAAKKRSPTRRAESTPLRSPVHGFHNKPQNPLGAS